MKPILFAKDETDFTTNGIGRLDCISCHVIEERNGIYELEAEIPISSPHASEIEQLSIIGAIPHEDGNVQAFVVYKITKPMNGRFIVYARHISYRLSDIPCNPFSVSLSPTACATTLAGLKSNAIEPCPFNFLTDVTTAGVYNQRTPASIRKRLGGVEGSVLDQFGGEYEFDNWDVKLWKSRGRLANVTGISLRYGKNITDINQEEEIANTVTGIVPFWIDTEGNNLVTLPEEVVYSSNASSYPYHLTIAVDFSDKFQEQPTVSQLRSVANAYISKQGVGVPKVSIKVSFVDLWKSEEYKNIAPLEKVKLCDEINVDFEKLGIDVVAKVVKTDWDVLKEKYISLEVGTIRTTLAQAVTDKESEIDTAFIAQIARMGTAIADATAWLTNANGYVVAVKNSDGSWKELLFMDTNNPDTAVNVLRINNNGLGFSTTGIDGPYRNAWTIDGHLVADFMNVGAIRGHNGKNVIDLDNDTIMFGAKSAKVNLSDGDYSGSYVPTNSNYPASGWSTDALKEVNLGKTFYNTNNQKSYVYNVIGKKGVKITFNSNCRTEAAQYDWVDIYYEDGGQYYHLSSKLGGSFGGRQIVVPSTRFWLYWRTDVSVHDYYGWKIDSIVETEDSATSFTTGDLPTDTTGWTLIDGVTNLPESEHNPYSDNLRVGYYINTGFSGLKYGWEEATFDNYINGAINNYYVAGLSQEDVFNKLTDNGENQGIYLVGNRLFINGQYIGAGEITIGGSAYGSQPVLKIRDTNNQVIGSWTVDGINAEQGTVGCLKITKQGSYSGNSELYITSNIIFISKTVDVTGFNGKRISKIITPYRDGFTYPFYPIWQAFPSGALIPSGVKYGTTYVRRKIGTGSWSTISQVVDMYYDGGTTLDEHYLDTNGDWLEITPENDVKYQFVFELNRRAYHTTDVSQVGIGVGADNVIMPVISTKDIAGKFRGVYTGVGDFTYLTVDGLDNSEAYIDGNGGVSGDEAEIWVENSSGSQHAEILSGSMKVFYESSTSNYQSVTITSGNVQQNISGTIKYPSWVSASDERIKENIKELDLNLTKNIIEGSKPMSFKFKKETGKHYGMIAQDVRKLLDSLGENDAELEHSMHLPKEVTGIDDQRMLDYYEYVPLLIKYVKYLNDRIKALESEHN